MCGGEKIKGGRLQIKEGGFQKRGSNLPLPL